MNQNNAADFFSILSKGEGMILFLFIFVVIYYLYFAFCLFRIAKKTATENAWFAWLPILDFFLMVRIAKKPDWWIILLFVPIINIITGILLWMGISKALGKPQWIGILMIITPINLIIPAYLAFSNRNENSQGPTIIASV
ncbi:MAG: DUF5684 domain-containing protein [Candidatus Moraniibacteriota bacterium]